MVSWLAGIEKEESEWVDIKKGGTDWARVVMVKTIITCGRLSGWVQ